MDVVYDFETLSTDTATGAVVSMAVLKFDPTRFTTKPYKYRELVDDGVFIKFDVAEQVKKYGRKIQPDTLEWWGKQGPEAKKQLKPSDKDISIEHLYDILYNDLRIQDCKFQYSRGCTFDSGFLKSILNIFGKDCPNNLYNARDTRSLIAGMSWGTDIKNTFMPDDCKKSFVHHDPVHDIAVDVYRIQTLAQALEVNPDDDIPF